MKRKYFWLRVYGAVMAVFLLALYGGVLAVGMMGWRQSLDAEVRRVEAQAQLVAGRLADTADRYGDQYRWALDALYTGLGEQEAEKGAYIDVYHSGEYAFAGVPEGLDTGVPGAEQLTRRATAGAQDYIVVSRPLGDAAGAYGFVYAADVTAHVQGWRQTFVLWAVLCAAIGAVVAVVLLVLLRRLSAPLERLEKVADGLAGGDLGQRVACETEDEIGRLGDSFNRMADSIQDNMDRLEHAAEQKQNMLDNLAHETRTPLTAIRGYAEYLQQAPLDEERRYEVAGRILEQAERMGETSDRILQLSALTRETMLVEQCGVEELFRKTKESMAPKAAQRGVAFEAIQPGVLMVRGDSVLLGSLLLNLADNAVKACGEGGRVTLEACEDEAGITLRVTDTGHGLTAEQIARLGEPFYRADMARARAEGGAGLGVALCRHIAALHGAGLRYTSAPQKGTRVEVAFAKEGRHET